MAVIETNAAPRMAEGALGLWGYGIARMIADWWNYRRTVRALSVLTDRELADIGLTRSEIRFAARHGR